MQPCEVHWGFTLPLAACPSALFLLSPHPCLPPMEFLTLTASLSLLVTQSSRTSWSLFPLEKTPLSSCGIRPKAVPKRYRRRACSSPSRYSLGGWGEPALALLEVPHCLAYFVCPSWCSNPRQPDPVPATTLLCNDLILMQMEGIVSVCDITSFFALGTGVDAVDLDLEDFDLEFSSVDMVGRCT